MPFFPNYRLTPSDRGTRLLTPFSVQGRFDVIAIDVGAVDIALDAARTTLLSNAVMQAVPDAASLVLDLRLFIIYPRSTQPLAFSGETTNPLVVGRVWHDWSGELICPPGSIIRGIGNFNLVAGNKELWLWLHGCLIPRGTFDFQ